MAELAEETGVHIGDGSMNLYSKCGIVSIAGHPKDDKEYYKEYLVPLYEKLYGVTPRLRHWSRAYGFQVCSTELVQFKNSLGLPLGPKQDIRIPAWIMNSYSGLKAACLRGIFDTDGTFFVEKKSGGYPRIQIRTTSKGLAEDIHRLLVEMGFKASKWAEKPGKEGWSIPYAVAVRGKQQIRKWMQEIGTSNPTKKSRYLAWKKGTNKNESA